LISTPIIIGLIDNVRKETFKDSAYGIIDAGEISYSQYLLEGITEEVTFTYTNGVEIPSIVGKELNYKGTKPQNGQIKVSNEGLVGIAIHNGSYCAKKGYYDSEVILSDEEIEKCSIPLYEDNTGASIPELTTGMIPVIYDGTNWVKADVIDKWYDYDVQEWANAVTVIDTNRDTYINATIGTIIPMDQINTMWVWIPKYEYETITSPTATEIKVNFISKSETTVTSNYIIHPAFTFGTTPVSGIWVGKFETTGIESALTILPNRQALSSLTVKQMYLASRAMDNVAKEIEYGWDTTQVDIHMAKNIEWGSIAYLSHSKYGVGDEIYINPSSARITGRGGNQVSQSSTSDASGGVSSTLYSYDGKQCNTKTGYECTGTSQLIYGMASSTTGNIYGVYDMSGGSWEYVMAMYRPIDGIEVTDNSGFGATTTIGDLSTIDEKYWNRYTTNDVLTSCNDGCYGHALLKTSNWYSDYAYFFESNIPWLVRGGYYGGTTGSGIFGYGKNDGNAYSYSFRVVLIGE
jgi:hypothetical protein